MEQSDRVLAGRIFYFVAWLYIILIIPFLAFFVFPVTGAGEMQQTMWLALISSALVLLVIALLCFRVAAGLRQQRDWARIAGMVMAALMLLSFPIGTIVGGLVLYFLIRDRAAPVE